MLWLLFLILVLLWISVTRWQNRRIIAMCKEMKCHLRSYPIVGNAIQFIGDNARKMQTLQLIGREANKHGGINYFWLGPKCIVAVTDSVDLEVIMKTSLEKGDLMKITRNLTGNGSIFAPVAIWRPRRKILVPTFCSNNLQNFMPIFSCQSQVMVEQLQQVAGTGIISVWQYLTSYTMSAVCETTLGVKMNVQTITDEPFLKAFEDISRLVADRILQPWLYPNAIYRLLPHQKMFDSSKELLYGFIGKKIQNKKLEIIENINKQNKVPVRNMKPFLQLLIENSTYSNTELLEEILVLVLAGTDTSAVGTAFIVSVMARYPAVQEKVYQEVISVLGGTCRPVRFEDLPHLKYLDIVIRETLRLYPPVPVTVRKIEKDLKLPSGITLVPGCEVLVHNWGVNRNPKYWGEDAEEFRPERFLDTPPKHPAAYMSFSYGPRNCLGQKYAMMSMKTAVATLLLNYRVLPKNPDVNGIDYSPIEVTFDVMMKDKDRFRVRLEKRTKIL